MQALRKIIVIDSQIRRRQMVVQAIEAESALSVAAQAQDLSEAHIMAETHLPNVVVISSELAAAAEFEMVIALTHMIGAECVIYGNRADFGLEGGHCAPMRARGDAVALAASLTQGGIDTYKPDPNAIVVIGASTGGVEAIEEILSTYPADCPPTVIVQHIRGTFSWGLVKRFGRYGNVRAAQSGMVLSRGEVILVCGDEHHARLTGKGRVGLVLDTGEPVQGHRPSVDVLFTSAAAFGPRVTGVLLTGMGRDGAEGLRAIRQAGGTTIGQDQGSCTVYGMPRAAMGLGAVQQELPIGSIGGAIMRATMQSTPRPKSALRGSVG